MAHFIFSFVRGREIEKKKEEESEVEKDEEKTIPR